MQIKKLKMTDTLFEIWSRRAFQKWLSITTLLTKMVFSQKQKENGMIIKNGTLEIHLDDKAKITAIMDEKNNTNYISYETDTYLLQVKRFSKKKILTPRKADIISDSNKKTTVALTFDNEIALHLVIENKKGYSRFEITGGTGINDIETVTWGPYNTSIIGSVGEFFGILKAEKFSIGIMSLNIKTDGTKKHNGYRANCAAWLPYPQKGSYIFLKTLGYTKERTFKKFRKTPAVPDLSVVGAAVALYGAPAGKELNQIEIIVKNENLPYPKYQGTWVKKSKKILSPGVWGHFDARSINTYIDLCKKIKAGVLCGFGHMFGNWGHFDPDPKLYPKGIEFLQKTSKRLKQVGINFTMYTLTNFIKPKTNIPEPFITPEVDPDFEKYDVSSNLTKRVSKTEDQIEIKHNDDVYKVIKQRESRYKEKVIQIDNELISFTGYKKLKSTIILTGIQRGYLLSSLQTHRKNAKVQFLYYAGYKNIFPGTLSMNKKVAENIGNKAREGSFNKVTFDGHESSAQTGYEFYAINQTMKTAYDINKDREMLYTSSNITNYCWHMLSYISWGEFDKEKGFKGTMLDYRIRRQLQLSRSLMPKKLGQHYPSSATEEDINWLFGQAVGWDSGVELCFNTHEFNKNPEKVKIITAIRKWEKARLSNKITAKQKQLLRQVDRVYKLKEKEDGSYTLSHTRRWIHPDVNILPSSIISLENPEGKVKIKKCSIDTGWTHSPLVFKEAAISNDIPLFAGKENSWNVTYPGTCKGDINRKQLQFVLRINKTAVNYIENPLFCVNNRQHFMIPVKLMPGQYLATPLNIPVVYAYNSRHNIIKEIPIAYSNDLCDINAKKKFTVSCQYKSDAGSKKISALLNLLYSDVIPKTEY
jgi:hypothetical protein